MLSPPPTIATISPLSIGPTPTSGSRGGSTRSARRIEERVLERGVPHKLATVAGAQGAARARRHSTDKQPSGSGGNCETSAMVPSGLEFAVSPAAATRERMEPQRDLMTRRSGGRRQPPQSPWSVEEDEALERVLVVIHLASPVPPKGLKKMERVSWLPWQEFEKENELEQHKMERVSWLPWQEFEKENELEQHVRFCVTECIYIPD